MISPEQYRIALDISDAISEDVAHRIGIGDEWRALRLEVKQHITETWADFIVVHLEEYRKQVLANEFEPK